ncbi:ADP-ribosyl-(dinitrogen reductase) hydrolase [Pseudomonas benzopyrenica]|uniref:ADP-ribosyl-(Dinitrogen reductase) hydrolase n=1 Tax=Pseudomonas benzopyrenica TaxID=2993566 RepID=A0ABZ2FMN3_9PSED
MKGLIISRKVLEKLAVKHGVTPREVEQCFDNCDGEHLEDRRERHRTNPITRWFVAETNQGRKLKILFIFRNGKVYLKSAYLADEKAIEIYNDNAY